MPENQAKDIIDIRDRNQAFRQTDDRLDSLKEGFYALALDYGYHIENIFGGNHRIIELRDNVIYRLFSSLLHCQLLLQQHIIIERRLKDIYKDDPGKILNWVYPKNPNFEYAEKEISAIFDSVVFHLSAIYDYLGILINFICTKEKQQTPKWTTISKSARDINNSFNKKDIAAKIDEIDREFVIKLYDYRSEIIHRTRDTNEYSFDLKASTGDFTMRFTCSDKLRKSFKNFGEKDLDYTVAHFSMWLINRTAETIAEILGGLKKEIQTNSQFPFHTYKDGNKPFIMYVNPETNVGESPSIINWDKFKAHFGNVPL
ncbi:hypothetical protein [Mucilaginibacter sp.]|uniref:hypothetical protein n=1 Tax=Mucilaginibacter sp. TaxID=1882438 RepID=UPI003D10999A